MLPPVYIFKFLFSSWYSFSCYSAQYLSQSLPKVFCTSTRKSAFLVIKIRKYGRKNGGCIPSALRARAYPDQRWRHRLNAFRRKKIVFSVKRNEEGHSVTGGIFSGWHRIRRNHRRSWPRYGSRSRGGMVREMGKGLWDKRSIKKDK